MAQTNKTQNVPAIGRRLSFERPQNFKKALSSLLVFSKRYLPLIIISLVLASIASILAVVGPNKMERLVNTIGEGIFAPVDIKAVLTIVFTLIAIYLTSTICMATQSLMMTKVSQSVSKQLRENINKKINTVPLKYIDSIPHGDLLSRITNDSDTIAQGLNNSVATFVHSVVLLLANLVMMMISNWILALATIFASMLGFALTSIVMKKSQKYFIAQQANLGKINGHIEEIYSGHNIVKVYNATTEETQKFNDLNTSLYSSAWKSQFLGGIMGPVMNFIGNFGYVVVCVLGSVLVVNNLATIGTIIAFIMYARMFTNPLSQIAQSLNFLQSTAAASERVFDFLGQEDLPDESHKQSYLSPSVVKGNVEFENINFGYNQDKTIINDFSIKIKQGQKVAIVGPTGAGKTTIVNLLMRFYEPQEGTIKIDGTPSIDLTRDNIHNLFGMVLQDTWLFEGTLRENLVFNNSTLTNEQIDAVIKECELDHFINTLPNGLDTILDDNTSVSAGQKQLLTIARAMLQNSPMIILDEATSSIDTRTELIIQKALDKLSKDRTSFVIAHRLSTIKNADIIIVMENGEIVETGNHRTLLAKNGTYARLYNSQFSTT